MGRFSCWWWVVAGLMTVGLLVTTPQLVHAQDRATSNLVHFDIEGNRFRLADYVTLEGEFPPLPDLHGPVILIFGAHWCHPCHEVIEYLHTRRAELGPLGVHVVYVHVDDVDRSEGHTRDQIRAFVQEMADAPEFEGVHMLLGGDLDEMQAWVNDPAFESLPAVVLIRADGSVHSREGGAGIIERGLEGFLGSPEAE